MIDVSGFLQSLLAHTLSDFVIQKESTVSEKNKGKFKQFFLHAFAVAFVTFLFLLPFKGLNPLYFALFVLLIHLLIDYLKHILDKLFDKAKSNFKALTFLLDQLLHIFSLLVLSQTIPLLPRPFFASLLTDFPIIEAYILIPIVYIFVVFGGAHFVRLILDSVPSKKGEKAENANKGKLIGILERTLMLTFWVTGNPSGIAIVLTAKSIARFKEFDDKEFAEYYLIGTLSSTLVALAGGIILLKII